MRRRAIAILAAVLMVVPALPMAVGSNVTPTGHTTDGDLEAGAARAEITPPIGTSMWGYTAREGVLATGEDLAAGEYPRYLDQRDDGVDTDFYGKTFLKSEGVHTRLFANAHVLDDGDSELAMVLVDLGGVPGELHQAVVDRLQDRGIPIDRTELLISATHTHAGPGEIFPHQGYALLGGGEFDPRVFGLVADQITKAVAQAYGEREPAEIAVGSAELEGATTNRAEGAHTVVHDDHADEDHVDETARVIRVDEVDGDPIGVITQFAAHGTIVGDEELFFSGDNQGVAKRMIREQVAEISDRVPDADDFVVSYLNGAEGDVSPHGRGATFFEAVEDAGRRQADPIVEEWARLGEVDGQRDVELDTRYKFVCFCGQAVEYRGWSERLSPIPILGAGGQNPAPANIPGHGNKTPFLIGPGTVPQIVRIQVARIGDHLFATMPGEPSMATGASIEHAIASLGSVDEIETVDVVGLANDYISYMTLVPEYEVQEYEGTFTLYGRMTTPMFRHHLVDMADKLLKDEPVDPGYEGLVEFPNLPLKTVDPVCPSTADSQCVPTGTPPGAFDQPDDEVEAGETVSFTWAGGRPAVDHPVDQVMIEVVHVDSGRTLVDDTGYTLRTWYQKDDLTHRWSVDWPTDVETPPGTYEIRVTGQHVDRPGHVAEYSLTSDEVTVQPAADG